MKVHEDKYVAHIPTLAVAVLPYNTWFIILTKLKSIYLHRCWETWHHQTSSQIPSGLSAGPIRCPRSVSCNSVCQDVSLYSARSLVLARLCRSGGFSRGKLQTSRWWLVDSSAPILTWTSVIINVSITMSANHSLPHRHRSQRVYWGLSKGSCIR